jgi:hypothetical protein
MHAFCVHCNQKMTSDLHSGRFFSGTTECLKLGGRHECLKLGGRQCEPGPLHLSHAEKHRQEALREMRASLRGDGSFDHAGVAKSLQDYP